MVACFNYYRRVPLKKALSRDYDQLRWSKNQFCCEFMDRQTTQVLYNARSNGHSTWCVRVAVLSASGVLETRSVIRAASSVTILRRR